MSSAAAFYFKVKIRRNVYIYSAGWRIVNSSARFGWQREVSNDPRPWRISTGLCGPAFALVILFIHSASARWGLMPCYWWIFHRFAYFYYRNLHHTHRRGRGAKYEYENQYKYAAGSQLIELIEKTTRIWEIAWRMHLMLVTHPLNPFSSR